MKYSEKWGDSVDSAVELALQELKLTKDQVTITVLEQPSSGFLGIIGNKPAKVRVEEIVKPSLKPVKEDLPKANKAPKSKKENKEQKKENIEEKPLKDSNKTELKISTKPNDLINVDNHSAKEFLDKIFKEMGLNVNVSVSTNKDSIYIDVDGQDTGTVIGKRGQTLDALQYLTSLVVNKGENEYIRVVLDAEGYRAKREATLEKLANRLAQKVLKTKKSVRLEPMNPYERKVIHTTLQGYNGINTRSEGEEPYRRVVIEIKK